MPRSRARHLTRYPASQEVLGTDPVGNEPPESEAARQRYADRLSANLLADRAAFITASGNGTFDPRKQGEMLPIGFPPVLATNNEVEGARIIQTSTWCKFQFFDAAGHSVAMAAGAELVVGVDIGFIPQGASFQTITVNPLQWQTAGGAVDAWTQNKAVWSASQWDGPFGVQFTLQLESSVQNVDLKVRWERKTSVDPAPEVWAPVEESDVREFNNTNSPQPLHGDLDGGHVSVLANQLQRLVLVRTDGGANATITMKRGTIRPYIPQF